MRSYVVNIAGIDHSVKLSEKTAKRLGAKPVKQPAKTGPSDAELAKQQAEEEARAEEEAKQAADAKAAAEEAEKAEAEKKAAEKAKETKPQNKAKTPQKK